MLLSALIVSNGSSIALDVKVMAPDPSKVNAFTGNLPVNVIFPKVFTVFVPPVEIPDKSAAASPFG